MEAFARSMDEYFAPEHTASQQESVKSKKVHKSIGGVDLTNIIPGFTSNNAFFFVYFLNYYIILTTLMDMSLQFAYPSNKVQKGYSVYCLFINTLQVISYLLSMGLILYITKIRGFNDSILKMPLSLVFIGYILALSLLINSSNYNNNLTTGSNVVLNLPRVIFIIIVIIFIDKDLHDKVKTGILAIILFFVCLTGIFQTYSPANSKICGIVTFILGIIATIGGIIKDTWGGGWAVDFEKYKTINNQRLEHSASGLDVASGQDAMGNVTGNETQ